MNGSGQVLTEVTVLGSEWLSSERRVDTMMQQLVVCRSEVLQAMALQQLFACTATVTRTIALLPPWWRHQNIDSIFQSFSSISLTRGLLFEKESYLCTFKRWAIDSGYCWDSSETKLLVQSTFFSAAKWHYDAWFCLVVVNLNLNGQNKVGQMYTYFEKGPQGSW